MNEQYDFAVYAGKKLKCKGHGTVERANDTAEQIARASRIGARTELYVYNAACHRWEMLTEWYTACGGVGRRRPDYEEAVLRGKIMPIASL